MTTLSSVADVTRQVQFAEESTYGVILTNPTLTNIGGITDISDSTDITAKRYRVLGSEDIYRGLSCGELYAFELKYNPSTTALARYGTELQGGGTGTIDKSLQILVGYKLNGVENFVVFKGCKTDKIDIEITTDDMSITQNFICQDITTPSSSTHGMGSPVFAAAFSGTPLCSTDTGVNPLTINSITYECLRFHASVSRNLHAVSIVGGPSAGAGKIAYLVPTVRDIDIDFDLLYYNTTTMADVKTLTARAASMVINSTGPKTFTMGNLQLESTKFDLSAESKEVFVRSFSGFAQTCTLTA